MKYKPLSKSFYQNTRKSFMAEMEPNSLAIFNSNDIYPISADSVMPFEQHRDLFYLSGIDQEESIIILFPDAIDPKHKEIAFVKKTNSHIEVWEGPKLNKEKKSIIKQLYSGFFSTSQLGATIICGGFFQKKVNPILVFSTLPAIQTSAFGMTLLRKNIINKEIWQIIYSLELLLVYFIWYLEYNNLYIIFFSIIAYIYRKLNINKYSLWMIATITTKYFLKV